MLSNFIRYFQKLTPVLLAGLIVACNEDYSSLTNESGENTGAQSRKASSSASSMKWSSNSLGTSGLKVYVSEDLINEFQPVDYQDDLNPVQQMLSEWNNSLDEHTLFDIDSASDENALSSLQHVDLMNYNDNVLGIYKHEDWFEDVSNSALAITQFFGKRINIGTEYEYLELIHADIIINYKEFSFGISDKSIEEYDLSSVILHELGHFLGLGHSGYNDISVMVPYLDIGVEKRELFEYDLDVISDLYQRENQQALSSFRIGSITHKASDNIKPEIVQGIIELQSNGNCRHIIDGKLIHEHKKKPGHFRPGLQ